MLFLTVLLSLIFVIRSFNIDSLSVHDNLFSQYQRYSEILSYIRSLPTLYPEKVSILNIGKSFQGREIAALKISSSPTDVFNEKPIILIDAGMHGREWMPPALALYIIFQLVENETNKHMIENIDWIIIPVLNPDGYEYSYINDTLWRKTMSQSTSSSCRGVDINRNFNIHWMKSTDFNKCRPSYGGPAPFSEPESRAFRDLAIKYQNNIKLYLNLHSFGSVIMFPWSYKTEPIPNKEEHMTLGLLVSNAIENLRGSKYTVGQISEMMYSVNGSSCDWMAGVLNIPLNFAIEMSTINESFQPPSWDIVPTVVEMFDGIKVFHMYVNQKWSKNTYN